MRYNTRFFLFAVFIFATLYSPGQNSNRLIERSVQRVYQEYKLFFDSSLLHTNVVLDKTRSYYRNYETQKIRSLARGDSAFAYNELLLSFAVVYLGDTITHLPACTMDTMLTLLPLGTPSNPRQHGDVLPPYEMLVKGKLAFNYKKLQRLLTEMGLANSAVELHSWPVMDEEKSTPGNPVSKTAYVWIVVTSCPEIKCRELQISASSGKILYDKKVN
jgi:hypothetical protein